jgi:DNA-binding transcriptional ArsR family regulator
LTNNLDDIIVNHMVKYLTPALDATFAALSDATRRGILAQLALGETSVSDLAMPYKMSLPAVSKHLRVLERAKLVERRKHGRVHRCRLVAEPMKGAAEWIERYRKFWEQQFDSLARYLEESHNEGDTKCQNQSRGQKLGSKSAAHSQHCVKKSSPRGRIAND